MTEFQQYQLWLATIASLIACLGLLWQVYCRLKDTKTSLRVVPAVYCTPADLEHRRDDAPRYLAIRVTNNSAFEVAISEIGLCLRSRFLARRQCFPLRCWKTEDDRALWPHKYDPCASAHSGSVVIRPRTTHEFMISQSENGDPQVRWAVGIYASAADGTIVRSPRWGLLSLLLGAWGASGILREWRDEATHRSAESKECIAGLLRERGFLVQDEDRLSVTLEERKTTGTDATTIAVVARNNCSEPIPFGESTVVLRTRGSNAPLRVPYYSNRFQPPTALKPGESFVFWAKASDVAQRLKESGLTGVVELVAEGSLIAGRRTQSAVVQFDIEKHAAVSTPGSPAPPPSASTIEPLNPPRLPVSSSAPSDNANVDSPAPTDTMTADGQSD
jgi:hypothetical protein